MAHSHTRQNGSTTQRTTALALLLLLLGLLGAPFATAQQAAQVPACCMDAQHCSMHLHRAAAGHDPAQDPAPPLAAVTPRCPCTPLAPASFASGGVPLLRSAGYAVTLRAQTAAPTRGAPLPRETQGRADAPRGPPQQASAHLSA